MLQQFIGKIRTPRYLQITLSTHEPSPGHPQGHYTVHFQTHPEVAGRPSTTFQLDYEGRLLQVKTVTDLLAWLRHAAKTSWGREDGGL